MLVQLTNAGAALLAANSGPIELSTFELGSAFGYIPEPTDTNIHGSLIYTGEPSSFLVINANVVKYSAYLDYDLGPFNFGELGLYTADGTLFALATASALITKQPESAGVYTGNSIRLDIYLSIVGQNYSMWLDYASSNNNFQMAVLQTPDTLPQPQNATPNAYIITGATSQQSSFLAYTSQTGLWNFDCYQYANQAAASITAFTPNSITISQSQYVPGMNPAYLGATIIEFSSGALYGICRYVSNVTLSGGNAILTFDTPLMMTPALGDTVLAFGRQQLSTTIPNLPVATTSTLGGVIIGNTLTVNSQGLINVAPTAFPVLSVNGMTGEVMLTASEISGLATVAMTGLYSSLIGTPPPYALPIASTSTLGGVMAPSDGNLTIGGTGVIDLGFSPVKTVNGISPDGTGNVTVPPATVIGLVAPQEIAAATDFNTLQTTGLYFGLDVYAATFLNAPNTTVGGVLDVEPFTTTASGGDVIQRYTQAGAMYFRRYSQSANTWSTWVQVSTSTALPPATTTTLGAVIVGMGLLVNGSGVLSAGITSVNGQTGSVSLTASDVNAVPLSAVNAQGGVPSLTITTTTPVPATDPYTYGRIPFFQNTLGTWENAGKWDASANHVIQAHTGNTTTDTNTSLASGGMQTIDISYNGNGPSGLGTPDYQTVSAEGNVYQVIVAGTTDLDGTSDWNVGDLAVVVNGGWVRIANSTSTPAPLIESAADTVKSNTSVASGTTATLSLPSTAPSPVAILAFISVNYLQASAGQTATITLTMTDTTSSTTWTNTGTYLSGTTLWVAGSATNGDALTLTGTIQASATALDIDAYMGYMMFATGG
jgi:hypothetical protein